MTDHWKRPTHNGNERTIKKRVLEQENVQVLAQIF